MEEFLRTSENNLRTLAGRLISTQEEERSRIARELHDDVTQRLAVLAIDMGKIEIQFASASHQVKDRLVAMRNDIVKVSEDIHALSRQLHPSILDDLGLVRAIQSECAAFTQRKKINVTFRHEDVPETIPRDVSLALYRIVQEGLSNIAKHSRAESAHILVDCSDCAINLSIRDAGIGFDPRQVQNESGLGLISMRERVNLVRGQFSVNSVPDEGTVIVVRYR
jgi:signal transduction histidine kinase